jgi:hypothetical protein
MSTVTRLYFTPPTDPVALTVAHRLKRYQLFQLSASTPISPTVENIIPTPDTQLAINQVVQFDVTTTNLIKRVLVFVRFNNLNIYEVAHDGTVFGPSYTNASCLRVPITGGFRFFLLRNNGWPDSPIVVADAFDTSGGED